MKKFVIIAAAVLTAWTASGQNAGRVKEIRAMYAQSQQVMKDQRDEAQINWFVKSTVNRNESAVGVVTYEMEYYPLQSLQAYDFVRGKRYYHPDDPTNYEILYGPQGKPVFYFERYKEFDGTPLEVRIYFEEDMQVAQYLCQRIVNGKKETQDADAVEVWYRTARAVAFANQEYKRGTLCYAMDSEGSGADRVIEAATKGGLFAHIYKMYDFFCTPEIEEEPDPEVDGSEILGLGKMSEYVTENFNQQYCLCQSKYNSTSDNSINFDVWGADAFASFKSITGVQILQYSDKKALVSVMVMGNDEETEVKLQLIFDAPTDSWLVNDFITKDGKSYLKVMQEYLRK